MVYLRGFLGKRRKYTQSNSYKTSSLDQIKSSGVPISTGYILKSESRRNENDYQKVNMNCGHQSRNVKNIQK